MFKKHVLAKAGSPSSKAAAILTRGAYSQYVSTAKWRERRWRLFSTFPYGIFMHPGMLVNVALAWHKVLTQDQCLGDV